MTSSAALRKDLAEGVKIAMIVPVKTKQLRTVIILI
jgi:hypothetical protein